VVGAAERVKHWAEFDERGSAWGPATLALVYRMLGRTACLLALAPVILFFYLSGARQRRASLDYLGRVWRAQGRAGEPGHWHALQHFFAFGESLIDKYAAWTGQINRTDIEAIDADAFEEMRRDAGGAIILSAHFGATDIIRAIASRDQRRRINIVIHTKHARRYNDLIKRFAPASQVALVEAGEFDITAAVELSAAIERGEWVVIMGDRRPVREGGRTVAVDFLGAPADFPQGPFVLAAALRCPTYMLFCYKTRSGHRVHFSTLTKAARLARRNRMTELRSLVQRYARVLEELVVAAPYQWFNFYEFWARPTRAGGDRKRGVDD
jgi:predicted LPLAT superfamily acyltransferase